MSNLIKMSETIRDHLTKQRMKSMAAYGGNMTQDCAYRGGNGLMCAVGCLITDEAYFEGLEGHCADDNRVVEALFNSLGFELTEDMVNLCMVWQGYHDDTHNGFSYRGWIDYQLDRTSPEMFHIHMMGCHS